MVLLRGLAGTPRFPRIRPNLQLLSRNADVSSASGKMEHLSRPRPRMDGIPTIDPSAAHEARLLTLSADLLGTVGFDGRIALANPAWGAAVEGTPLVEVVDPAD